MAKKKTGAKQKSTNGAKQKSARGATDGAPAATGSAAEFERFLPEALKLDRRAVLPLNADVSLALGNAKRGVDALLARPSELKGLPGVSVARIKSLSQLGLALAFSAGRVERFAPPPTGIKGKLSRLHQLRGMLLDSAQALASAGLVPEGAVRQIRHGRGGIDAAGDCVALAALFRKYPAALKKAPVSAADVKEAAALGTELIGVLKPKSARRVDGRSIKQARDERDRLWTLFVQRWEQDVWRVGAWIFGRKVGQHVPPLLSHTQRRSAGKAKAKAKPKAKAKGNSKPVAAPAGA